MAVLAAVVTASVLGEAGAGIAILARDTAQTAEVVDDLQARGPTAPGFRGDVAQLSDVERRRQVTGGWNCCQAGTRPPNPDPRSCISGTPLLTRQMLGF